MCPFSLEYKRRDFLFAVREDSSIQHTSRFLRLLKGCGRHHQTDIGLVGLRTNLYGETQKAARVFLGGEYSKGKKVSRLIFGVVPLVHLKSVFEVIIEEFETSREKDFENFSLKYLNPHSTSFLLLWFLAKLYLKKKITLGSAI